MKKILLLALAWAGASQASTLTLTPSAGTVAQGSDVTLTLALNATDFAPGDSLAHPGMYGGRIVITFDSTLLTYKNDFALQPGLGYLTPPPAVTTNGNLKSLTLGFYNAPDSGTVGTFSFTAIGTPGSQAQIGMADQDIFGSFNAISSTNAYFAPVITGTQVNISAVPLPAGIWLLGTGIGALAARRRWRA